VTLRELRLEDVRCLRRAELELHPRLNLITGENGSGKTSVLEAAYLLGRGRSFRTRHTERLIRHASRELRVFGRVAPLDTTIGVAFDRAQGATVQINRRPATSTAELAELFPVQVIDPGIHRLVEEGPSYRRRWLDWGVFHVEHAFVARWSDYTRALKQRNAALKQGNDTAGWDAELARLGEGLTDARARLVTDLADEWQATLARLTAPPVALQFYRGWSSERSLAESLSLNLSRDHERGMTGNGPHRFDVHLRLEGHAARDILSRGQQKLLGAAMALALSRFVAQRTGRLPTLLLDDPAAELDAPHTAALLGEIATLDWQLLVTSLHPEELRLGRPERVFHVEQGGVRTL
jgi:DNA replication and repair protein RecF